MFAGSVASYAQELVRPDVAVCTSGDTMKVTATVGPMTTEAVKPANGGPSPQQGSITTDEEVEATQQQRSHSHLARIVSLTNGNTGAYHDDRPGKPIVNGTSKSLKVESPPGDLRVTNGDSSHSAPKKLQHKTDSTASKEPRYLLISNWM